MHNKQFIARSITPEGYMLSASKETLKDYNEFFMGRMGYAMPARGSLRNLLNEQEVFGDESSHFRLFNSLMSRLALLACVGVMLIALAQGAYADARIKDIADFEGVRDNVLMGYGLVVGLNGTGDKLKNNEFTSQSLIAFLERQGVNTRGTELKSKNVAAVTVTASLPPFARAGEKINVSVSALGDARSLQGGTLLATALYGADGNVYVVAQGAISLDGMDASTSGTTIPKGVPTNGFIANGGIVEREINFSLNKMSSMNIGLRNPDILTAKYLTEAINKHLGVDAAEIVDPGTVHLRVPIDFKGRAADLLAEIEQLPVKTDQMAKVVIDEASGTVVMGENVRIDTVAVAQGNLIVKVEEPQQEAANGTPAAQQPAPPPVLIEENKSKLAVLRHGASLRELIAGLNALGVGPRDLINILQTIKTAGALQAEVISK